MALPNKIPGGLSQLHHSAAIFADASIDGPEIGTLVLIVDRAKNLPNRKTIGKQDPYCAARLGKEAHKTKTDIRGGQTPRWDQELRFTVHDSPDYYQLKVSVFNDDKRTELIGETWIDLKNIIHPGGGQSDRWQNLGCRGKYAGEIRIELTYYDNRPKPIAPLKLKSADPEAVDPNGSTRRRSPIKRRPLPSDPVTGETPAHVNSVSLGATTIATAHMAIRPQMQEAIPPPAHIGPRPQPTTRAEKQEAAAKAQQQKLLDLQQEQQRLLMEQHLQQQKYEEALAQEKAAILAAAMNPPMASSPVDIPRQSIEHSGSPSPQPHSRSNSSRYSASPGPEYGPPQGYHSHSPVTSGNPDADDTPPPPPVHRNRGNSASLQDVAPRSSFDGQPKPNGMRQEVLRNEAHRNSFSGYGPSDGPPPPPGHQYEQAAQPRPQTQRANSSNRLSMQPTVEDVPDSPKAAVQTVVRKAVPRSQYTSSADPRRDSGSPQGPKHQPLGPKPPPPSHQDKMAQQQAQAQAEQQAKQQVEEQARQQAEREMVAREQAEEQARKEQVRQEQASQEHMRLEEEQRARQQVEKAQQQVQHQLPLPPPHQSQPSSTQMVSSGPGPVPSHVQQYQRSAPPQPPPAPKHSSSYQSQPAPRPVQFQLPAPPSNSDPSVPPSQHSHSTSPAPPSPIEETSNMAITLVPKKTGRPVIPASLIPGIDPIIAQEISELTFQKRQRERERSYSTPVQPSSYNQIMPYNPQPQVQGPSPTPMPIPPQQQQQFRPVLPPGYHQGQPPVPEHQPRGRAMTHNEIVPYGYTGRGPSPNPYDGRQASPRPYDGREPSPRPYDGREASLNPYSIHGRSPSPNPYDNGRQPSPNTYSPYDGQPSPYSYRHSRSPSPNPYGNAHQPSPNHYSNDRQPSPNPYLGRTPSPNPYSGRSPSPYSQQPGYDPHRPPNDRRNSYQAPPAQGQMVRHGERGPSPVPSPRASPNITYTIRRKSVSPAPPLSADRRSYGPGSYDTVNPNPSSSSGGIPPKASTHEKIITHDGKEIDPSDHLPISSWAPEPNRPNDEEGREIPPTTSRPLPNGYPGPSGRRQLRIAGHSPAPPGQMVYHTPNDIQATYGPPARNRLQKKANRVSAAPEPQQGGYPDPIHHHGHGHSPSMGGPVSPRGDNFMPGRMSRAHTWDMSQQQDIHAPPYAPRSSGPVANPVMNGALVRMAPAAGPPPATADDWALMEEMKRIDIGAGRSRRHGGGY